MKSEELLKVVAKAIDEKHGEDVLIYDMRNISLLADYIVITNGGSNRQTNAIAENVVEQARKAGFDDYKVEGNKDSDWILLDLKDVLVNVFTEETRDFYQLEKLWSDAPEISLSELLD